MHQLEGRLHPVSTLGTQPRTHWQKSISRGDAVVSDNPGVESGDYGPCSKVLYADGDRSIRPGQQHLAEMDVPTPSVADARQSGSEQAAASVDTDRELGRGGLERQLTAAVLQGWATVDPPSRHWATDTLPPRGCRP